MEIFNRLQIWTDDVRSIRWRDAVVTLRERFREDRLGLTAGSLTFTTTIALVPFITVALAVFTAFPMFAKFEDVLQKWLVQSLIPDNIARQVLGYTTQFAGKASRLGVAGLVALLGSALALVFTIDRTLNAIWRVRTRRPFGQRVLIYWAAITLGPVVLGVSLSVTSYVISASRGLVGELPGGVRMLLDVLQFVLVAGGMASTYRLVPNTFVRWGHAWIGGLLVASGIEVAKKVLALYLGLVPTYSVVYGAFATVPILLIWIYVAWAIVLLGATLTAYLPNLTGGVVRRRSGAGWQFLLALEVLGALARAARTEARGCTLTQLRTALGADTQRLEPVVEALVALDWVGQLNEAGNLVEGARLVLLVDPAQTALEPLVERLLLPRTPASAQLWRNGRWAADRLADVI